MSPEKRKSSSRPSGSSRSGPSRSGPSGPTVGVRIVGGRFRGRKLRYTGDPRTRPMKDRVREAIFNVLGPAVRAKHALDLFAGTGALGLEALSRGAAGATFIEQHHPTAQALRGNIAELGVADLSEVITGNVFLWLRRSTGKRGTGTEQAAVLPPSSQQGSETVPLFSQDKKSPRAPWLVFCSPPYDFYVDRWDDMLQLLATLLELAPAESIFVVEADERFDFGLLPSQESWDLRAYPPAMVGIYHRPG